MILTTSASSPRLFASLMPANSAIHRNRTGKPPSTAHSPRSDGTPVPPDSREGRIPLDDLELLGSPMVSGEVPRGFFHALKFHFEFDGFPSSARRSSRARSLT